MSNESDTPGKSAPLPFPRDAVLEGLADGFVAFDRQWRYVYVNARAEQILGRSRHELLGKVCWEEDPETVGTPLHARFLEAMEAGCPDFFESFNPDEQTWTEFSFTPWPEGLAVFQRDITPRRRAEQEAQAGAHQLAVQEGRQDSQVSLRDSQVSLSDSEERFRLLVEQVKDYAIFVLDPEGHVSTWNAGAERFKGYTAAEIIGHHFSRFYTPEDIARRHPWTELEIAAREGRYQEEGWRVRKDGTRFWADVTITALRDPAGRLRGYAKVTRDVTERREQERASDIAQQLQEALQPDIPAQVADLVLGRYTRPALAEASVGGDFYDVFPLDKSLCALVIGDVSGKGLAAAQQLALIRNCLRTTLYLYRAPVEAVAAVNAIVTAHNLLVGFVTAWVGVYDSGAGQIAYASCGHEPGLVRRTDGSVEMMETTGPPLGAAEWGQYAGRTVGLSPGDALLLYTDGLSEAGPSRRQMLGTEGLAQLFRDRLPGRDGQGGDARAPDVQEQAEALVREVSAYAGGAFHDDVAVLLVQRR